MERLLEIVALIVTGPLVGIELGVAAIVGPLAAKLPDSGFRVVRSGGSRWLGALMPFWYIGALVPLIAVAILSGGWPAVAAAVVMAATLLLTVTTLVPINNRVARWASDADVDRSLTQRWDRLHWLRVSMLALTLVLLAISAR
jgi:hypothetical protein